jgi:hypothetical protein
MLIAEKSPFSIKDFSASLVSGLPKGSSGKRIRAFPHKWDPVVRKKMRNNKDLEHPI